MEEALSKTSTERTPLIGGPTRGGSGRKKLTVTATPGAPASLASGRGATDGGISLAPLARGPSPNPEHSDDERFREGPTDPTKDGNRRCCCFRLPRRADDPMALNFKCGKEEQPGAGRSLDPRRPRKRGPSADASSQGSRAAVPAKAWRFYGLPLLSLLISLVCLLPFMIPQARSAVFVIVTLVAASAFVLAVQRGWVPAALGLVYWGDGENGIVGVILLLVCNGLIALQGFVLRLVRSDLALVGPNPKCTSEKYICERHGDLINVYAYAALAITIAGCVRYAGSQAPAEGNKWSQNPFNFLKKCLHPGPVAAADTMSDLSDVSEGESSMYMGNSTPDIDARSKTTLNVLVNEFSDEVPPALNLYRYYLYSLVSVPMSLFLFVPKFPTSALEWTFMLITVGGCTLAYGAAAGFVLRPAHQSILHVVKSNRALLKMVRRETRRINAIIDDYAGTINAGMNNAGTDDAGTDDLEVNEDLESKLPHRTDPAHFLNAWSLLRLKVLHKNQQLMQIASVPFAVLGVSTLLVTAQLMVAVFATCKADPHTVKSLIANDCFWLEIVAHLCLIAGWCFNCLLMGASAAQTQILSARELHELAFALDVLHQQRVRRSNDWPPAHIKANRHRATVTHPVAPPSTGAEAKGLHESFSAGNPPAASAYARRLATQITDRERRPQLFDTFAFVPSTIYGVIGYCISTGVAVLYKDIQTFLTKDVSQAK